MSIHSVYLVSDLEGSDNGNPIVCSYYGASQDTLGNCTKCKGLLANARLEPSLVAS